MAIDEEEIEKAKKLRQEYDELKNSSEELTDAEKERLEVLEKIFKQAEKNAKQAADAVTRAQNYVEVLTSLKQTTEITNLKFEAQLSLLRAQKEEVIAQIKEAKTQGAQHEENLKRLDKELDAVKKLHSARLKNQETLADQLSIVSKTRDVVLRMIADGGMANMGKGLAAMANSGADMFLGRLIGAAKESFLAFDKFTKSFERQYALGEDFKEQTKDLYKELDILGVTMEDLTKASSALVDSYTDFTMLNEASQRSLRQTANILEKSYGVAFEDFANGLQTTTKAMGMSERQAESFAGELAGTAEYLGVSIPGLVQQFSKMGPQLAKFGSEGMKTFKELARISKLTGMEIEKLLSITNKFDTFEGAAERAGMLNAALGGSFVNAMDLMMATDPAERFMMIRDAIDQTGLGFDEMGYYQKKFFAEAAGLDDVNDLALLMSGNMDMLAGASNQSAAEIVEQKERARELQDVMSKLNTIFVDLANSTGILDMSADSIIEKFKGMAATIGWIVVGIKGLGVAYGIWRAFKIKSIASSLTAIATGGKEVAMTEAQTGALLKQNKVLISNLKLKANIKKQMGTMPGGAVGGGMSAGAIAAIGVALVGFGFGLKLAAEGMAQFVTAFSGFDWGEMLAMTLPILALTLGFGAFAAALIFLTPTAAGAAGPLLAVGAAVGFMGLGLGLAAVGMAELVKSFKGLKVTELVAAGVAIWGLSSAIVSLATALATMANPLSLAGAGVLIGIAAAGAGISFVLGKLFGRGNKEKESAENMSLFFDSLSGVSESQLAAAENAFGGIKQAINDTDGWKLAGYALMSKSMKINIQSPQPATVTSPPIPTNTITNNNTTVAGGGGKTEVTGQVELTFNTDLFEKRVVEIVNKNKQTSQTITK